jgi:16S rRNA (cytosine1402-N4)-methyltransferase
MSNSSERHVPVLFDEAIEFLRVRKGATVVDCTLGYAGHASLIAKLLGPSGHLIAFDRDAEAMELARVRLTRVCEELGSEAPRVTMINDAFSTAPRHLASASADAILADFGVSSMQLEGAHRGFSFMVDGPLDMRQDARQALTAEQVVNEASERELADLIYEYGEERRSRRIARAIVRGRPVTTTGQLARIVAQAAPAMKQERIHPATRTFQALRIVVNQELDEIRALLDQAPELLKFRGRLVVISFHSLEDRIVKDKFREGQGGGVWEILTRKPVTAGEEEIERNPRSRSAKLRAAEKIKSGSVRGPGSK